MTARTCSHCPRDTGNGPAKHSRGSQPCPGRQLGCIAGHIGRSSDQRAGGPRNQRVAQRGLPRPPAKVIDDVPAVGGGDPGLRR
jgi:hypothetical protein